MELETMCLERDGKVARLTLNRPHLLNAMDYQAALDLNQVVEAVRDDRNVRLLVIRGAGRAFCTGIDLKQLSMGDTPVAYYERWDRALRILEMMDKFVLCGIQGYALGGGLQLALASDIRVATEDAKLGLPAINESIVPGLSTFRLPRYVGWGRAKRMVLTGENVDGREAHAIGLVDYVVPADRLDEAVEDRVTELLKTCSVGAQHSKILLGLYPDMPWADFFVEYMRRQEMCIASQDHEEARLAYRDGRMPVWA